MSALSTALNFIPQTLESVLNFTNKNLASALNFSEKKVSDYFEPKPGEVRIRDVAREAQGILSKPFEPGEEEIKYAEQHQGLNKYGQLLIKNPVSKSGYTYADPIGAFGMKNVAKEGLDAFGKQMLKNIKGNVISKIAPKLEPLAQEAGKYKSAEEFVKVIEDKINRKSITLEKLGIKKMLGGKGVDLGNAYKLQEGYSSLTDFWNKAVREVKPKLPIYKGETDKFVELIKNVDIKQMDYNKIPPEIEKIVSDVKNKYYPNIPVVYIENKVTGVASPTKRILINPELLKLRLNILKATGEAEEAFGRVFKIKKNQSLKDAMDEYVKLLLDHEVRHMKYNTKEQWSMLENAKSQKEKDIILNDMEETVRVMQERVKRGLPLKDKDF